MVTNQANNSTQIEVDIALIRLFLRMTPEERLLSNDKHIQTLLELQNAYTEKNASIRS